MNGVKASCVGPTFALARCSDSATGSKKSRRQSKEDRKALVVTFIKKYQNSNNGNFPSLSLTQKEVGGSFYKVREIVREVIQENRVLGPAKLTPDDQNHDIVSEQYPLGSISTETMFVSAEETLIVSKDDKSFKEELLSTVNGQSIGEHQQISDKAGYDIEVLVDGECEEGDASRSSAHVNDGMLHVDSQTSHEVEKKVETSGRTYDNRNLVDGEGKESDANKSVHLNHDMLHTDVKTAQKAEKKLDIEEASISKITPLATDVIVETFPMKSSAKVTKVRDDKPDDSKDLSRTLEDNEIKELDMVSAAEKTISMMHRMTIMEMESSRSCDEKSTENGTDPSFPKIAPNGKTTLTENINPKKATSTSGESVSQEELAMETQADIQYSQSMEEGKKSTLNRMNLESWEGAIKKPAVNPVLAVFKAFITSFVKFWLE